MSRLPRALLLGGVIAVCAAPGARASDAGTITKTAGAVSATLQWQAGPEDLGGVSHPRLTITRSGATVFDSEITDVCGVGCILVTDTPQYADYSALKVVDLDGDGEPEAIVDTYSGGAHCCISARVYGLDAARAAYSRIRSYDWLDSDYKVVDRDGDGKPELSGSDASFSYAFSSYAASQFPPLIVQLHRDGATGRATFADVTRHYPAVIRSHAARMLKLIRKAKRQDGPPYEIQGAIAAYVGDEYLLGHGSVGKAEMRRDHRKGLTAKNFSALVLKFLKRLHYR